ncbi:MAG: pilus assembly PilX N-terminal domain-containing protein [Myxococcota bacterium]
MSPRPQEAGAALIIAFTVMIVLSVLGLMVMQTISVDLDVAGAERSSEHALYIAEAGLNGDSKNFQARTSIAAMAIRISTKYGVFTGPRRSRS